MTATTERASGVVMNWRVSPSSSICSRNMRHSLRSVSSMNMARMPGETKPVYSWMYWKPPFLSMPISGAITTASSIDTTTVTRPIHTIFFSVTSGCRRFW